MLLPLSCTTPRGETLGLLFWQACGCFFGKRAVPWYGHLHSKTNLSKTWSVYLQPPTDRHAVPAKTRTIMPAKVVFSFAVGADSSRAVDGVLRNAIRFLTAPIMLHVSSNSRYHWGDPRVRGEPFFAAPAQSTSTARREAHAFSATCSHRELALLLRNLSALRQRRRRWSLCADVYQPSFIASGCRGLDP